jgi:hypothetical protein
MVFYASCSLPDSCSLPYSCGLPDSCGLQTLKQLHLSWKPLLLSKESMCIIIYIRMYISKLENSFLKGQFHKNKEDSFWI